MSRTGIEAKLPWKQIPKAVRQQVDLALGVPVARATRIWGGYSPTPTYRLALTDGRSAFFKATYQATNPFAINALRYEVQIYRELGDLLAPWTPRLYATFEADDWRVLLLEDLGPKSVPPWTPGKARAIAHALAAFHHSSLGAALPTWLVRPDERVPRENWSQVAQESQEFQQLAALIPDSAPQVLAWFRMITPSIEALLESSILATGPYALLHGDLRSDNLRFNQGRLYLFDWPAITVGRPEWDMVAFVQTIAVEGGPAPEQIMQWYTERFPVQPAAIDSALAWWLTFFASRAWRPEIPELPRLRRFQRQQLGTLLLWAARQWALPRPIWAEQWLQ
ncbi:hypothetical protein BH10CHL1_BH10CHL1_43170 [soil metagenome]